MEEAQERQKNGVPSLLGGGVQLTSTSAMLHRRALAGGNRPAAAASPSPRPRSLLPPGSAGELPAQSPISSASQFRGFDDDHLQSEGEGAFAPGHQAFPPMQMGEIMLEEVRARFNYQVTPSKYGVACMDSTVCVCYSPTRHLEGAWDSNRSEMFS